MSPINVSIIAFIVVVAGGFAGRLIRVRLPDHHLDSSTTDTIKMGIGFLATLAALVLGLLVSSAKSSFDAKGELIRNVAVQILQLDSNLRRLGPPAEPIRNQVLQLISGQVARMSGSQELLSHMPQIDPSGASVAVGVQHALARISASDPALSGIAGKAAQEVEQLEQFRYFAIASGGSAITVPLLVVLLLWLAGIAAGWNVIGAPNRTVLGVTMLCALSMACAIFLILEMDSPFGGLLHVSVEPLQAALAQLKR
ncbi:MAG TPA: hypothetical protein PK225_01210 [Azonexus sp.]|jgi:hypothetical protein|nr:hypothetical protein [Azonexus sp.]